jgi:large subunit ribosomal protein L6
MSRVAKYPVVLPKGVEVAMTENQITVKGPLGSLTQFILPAVKVDKEGESLFCRAVENQPTGSAMSGTMRALVNNMVTGVTKGFEKKLTLIGVGYKAQAQGTKLNLSLGYSHPIVHEMPSGIKVETPTQTEILIKGIDRQLVGQVAAEVRSYRSPEPYKGKGIRYADEVVVIKATKKK